MRPIDADRLIDELMKKAPSIAEKIVPLIEGQKTVTLTQYLALLREVLDGEED